MECMLSKVPQDEMKKLVNDFEIENKDEVIAIWKISKPDFDDSIFFEFTEGEYYCAIYHDNVYTKSLNEVLEFINKEWWGE